MNMIKTTALLTAMTLLFVFGGYAMGGESGMVIAFVLAIGMNFFAYFNSDTLALKAYKATELSEHEVPWLYEIVRNLAHRGGMPMPKIYLIPGDQPNAFATGRNPSHAAVAVTEGIMRILDRDELAGVLAHEMAHVKNYDILIGSVAAVLAGAIAMMASMAQWAMIFGMGRNSQGGGNPIMAIVMMIVAPMAAMVVQMAVSRTREYQADKIGAELLGDPRPLASALRKLQIGASRIPMDATPATAHMFIVNPLSGRDSLASLFSTHPPMDKRIAALLAMRQGASSGGF